MNKAKEEKENKYNRQTKKIAIRIEEATREAVKAKDFRKAYNITVELYRQDLKKNGTLNFPEFDKCLIAFTKLWQNTTEISINKKNECPALMLGDQGQ